MCEFEIREYAVQDVVVFIKFRKTLTLKMASAIFVEMLQIFQHSTMRIPKSLSRIRTLGLPENKVPKDTFGIQERRDSIGFMNRRI